MPGGSKAGGGLKTKKSTFYKMKGSPHKLGTIEGTSAFKQKDGEYVTAGDYKLYNFDGTLNEVATNDPEETSKIYTDEGGNKVVDYTTPDGGTDQLLVGTNKPK